MKYERREQNRIKKERLANLVQLYIDTDDINVFLINLHIRYYDLISYIWKFKFYYFKTMHPFWSAFLHLVPTFIVSVLMALFYAIGVVTLEIMILSELYAKLKTWHFLTSTFKLINNTTSAINRGLKLHERNFPMFRRYN